MEGVAKASFCRTFDSCVALRDSPREHGGKTLDSSAEVLRQAGCGD